MTEEVPSQLLQSRKQMAHLHTQMQENQEARERARLHVVAAREEWTLDTLRPCSGLVGLTDMFHSREVFASRWRPDGSFLARGAAWTRTGTLHAERVRRGHSRPVLPRRCWKTLDEQVRHSRSTCWRAAPHRARGPCVRHPLSEKKRTEDFAQSLRSVECAFRNDGFGQTFTFGMKVAGSQSGSADATLGQALDEGFRAVEAKHKKKCIGMHVDTWPATR